MLSVTHILQRHGRIAALRFREADYNQTFAYTYYLRVFASGDYAESD